MCVPILLIPALIRGGQSRTDGSNRHSCGSTIVTPYGCNELYISKCMDPIRNDIYIYVYYKTCRTQAISAIVKELEALGLISK